MAWDSTSLKTDSHTDSNCPFISASLIWNNNAQSVVRPGQGDRGHVTKEQARTKFSPTLTHGLSFQRRSCEIGLGDPLALGKVFPGYFFQTLKKNRQFQDAPEILWSPRKA